MTGHESQIQKVKLSNRKIQREDRVILKARRVVEPGGHATQKFGTRLTEIYTGPFEAVRSERQHLSRDVDLNSRVRQPLWARGRQNYAGSHSVQQSARDNAASGRSLGVLETETLTEASEVELRYLTWRKVYIIC